MFPKRIKLTSDQLDSINDIISLYELVAKIEGIDNKEVSMYHPDKLDCSNHIQEIIFRHYELQGLDKVSIGMMWCNSGPKVNENLKENEVFIYDGFATFLI